MRTKHTGYAVRSLGVLGAIGVATLLGGCDTSTRPDAPAESGTTPASSDSTATIAGSTVSIPETVSTPAAGDENEAGDVGDTVTGVAPTAPLVEPPAATFPAPAQSIDNETDGYEVDENEGDENEPDEQDGENEADENEADENEGDENEADEAGD